MDRRTFLLAAPALLVGRMRFRRRCRGPARAGARLCASATAGSTTARDGFRVPVTWVETHEVTAMDAQGIDVRVTCVGAR